MVVGSWNGDPGQYAISLSEPAADVFNMTDTFAVAPGQPVGAGTLPGVGELDEYHFTVPATRGYVASLDGCTNPDTYYQIRPVGETWWWGGWCDRPQTAFLTAGDYRLIVHTDYGPAGGDYNLTVEHRPDPQTFDVTLGDTITDGTPSAGAGRLEQHGSRDVYRFTVTQPRYVTFNGESCPTGGLNGQLQAVGVNRFVSLCDDRRLLLHPNHYTLTITGNPSPYTLELINP